MALLHFSPGSKGEPPGRYTLQLPFDLADSHAIKLEDGDAPFSLGEFQARIQLKKGVYVLRVAGLPSLDAAQQFFRRLSGSLLRLTVLKRLSLRFSSDLQDPDLFGAPIDVRNSRTFGDLFKSMGWTHLDGTIDPAVPVVIPEHLRLMSMGAGALTVSTATSLNTLVDVIQEGIGMTTPEAVVDDEQLALSIRLYTEALRQGSRRGQLITLTTALEALVDQGRVGDVTDRHVNLLLNALDASRDHGNEDTAVRRELDRLASGLGRLKRESIKQSLRRLVEKESEALEGSVEQLADNMDQVYDVRSRLLHDGTEEEKATREAASWLVATVPCILERQLERACQYGSRWHPHAS